MRKIANVAAVDITEDEWRALGEAFTRSEFAFVIPRLREVRNEPQSARTLLGEDRAYSGDDRVNNVLRKAKSPFKLGRIDVWAEGQDRNDRKLALVRK